MGCVDKRDKLSGIHARVDMARKLERVARNEELHVGVIVVAAENFCPNALTHDIRVIVL